MLLNEEWISSGECSPDSGTYSGGGASFSGGSPPHNEDDSSDCSSDTKSDPVSFYNFHLSENGDDEGRGGGDDDGFAGQRYLDSPGEEARTILSSKGTIRGVKNRVRAGIATFLSIDATKTWQEKEAGTVVVYTTGMGIVRETAARCQRVRHILRTHLVKYREKDAYMSREVQAEIRERTSSDRVNLPVVFVDGQYLGDAETVEKLNETGELRRILKPYKSREACTTCQVCGGYRVLPCGVCNGSKKSVHRNHFTAQLVALKCMNCDEVGLIKCFNC